MSDLYDVPIHTLQGEPSSLAPFKGKALLLVNVASRCGLTPQYAGLQKLQDTYGGRGFSVLGFPCNQFLEQEPGTADEIAEFCSVNYGVTFPLFEKIEVNGPGRHPLYDELTAKADAEGAGRRHPVELREVPRLARGRRSWPASGPGSSPRTRAWWVRSREPCRPAPSGRPAVDSTLIGVDTIAPAGRRHHRPCGDLLHGAWRRPVLGVRPARHRRCGAHGDGVGLRSRPLRGPASACCHATTATGTATAPPGHGADHLLPVLVSPSLVVPVLGGRPALGTWQRVVMVDTNADNPDRQVRLSFVADSSARLA